MTRVGSTLHANGVRGRAVEPHRGDLAGVWAFVRGVQTARPSMEYDLHPAASNATRTCHRLIRASCTTTQIKRTTSAARDRTEPKEPFRTRTHACVAPSQSPHLCRGSSAAETAVMASPFARLAQSPHLRMDSTPGGPDCLDYPESSPSKYIYIYIYIYSAPARTRASPSTPSPATAPTALWRGRCLCLAHPGLEVWRRRRDAPHMPCLERRGRCMPSSSRQSSTTAPPPPGHAPAAHMPRPSWAGSLAAATRRPACRPSSSWPCWACT
eukprot:362482-Chlamydomonas_euryale.AAC.2